VIPGTHNKNIKKKTERSSRRRKQDLEEKYLPCETFAIGAISALKRKFRENHSFHSLLSKVSLPKDHTLGGGIWGGNGTFRVPILTQKEFEGPCTRNTVLSTSGSLRRRMKERVEKNCAKTPRTGRTGKQT